MASPQDLSHFSETTLPRQDYVARIFGYGVAALAMFAAMHYGYYGEQMMIVPVIALTYPHLIYILSRDRKSTRLNSSHN